VLPFPGNRSFHSDGIKIVSTNTIKIKREKRLVQMRKASFDELLSLSRQPRQRIKYNGILLLSDGLSPMTIHQKQAGFDKRGLCVDKGLSSTGKILFPEG